MSPAEDRSSPAYHAALTEEQAAGHAFDHGCHPRGSDAWEECRQRWLRARYELLRVVYGQKTADEDPIAARRSR